MRYFLLIYYFHRCTFGVGILFRFRFRQLGVLIVPSGVEMGLSKADGTAYSGHWTPIATATGLPRSGLLMGLLRASGQRAPLARSRYIQPRNVFSYFCCGQCAVRVPQCFRPLRATGRLCAVLCSLHCDF